MGYDIKICPVYPIDSNTFERGSSDDRAGLSYNWSSLRHQVKWCILEDLDGHSSREVSARIQETLARLRDEGFGNAKSDPRNYNQGWGVDTEGNLLPLDQRISIFMDHLAMLDELARAYPNDYFITDSNSGYIIVNGEKKNLLNQ